MHHLVLGGSVNHLYLLNALKKRGDYVTLVDRNPKAAGRQVADNFILGSTFDETDWLNKAQDVNSHHPFTSLHTASSGPPVRVLSRLSQSFSIPLYSERIATISTSKSEFRKTFPYIKHKIINESSPDVDLFYPSIIKSDFSPCGKESVRWAKNRSMAEKGIAVTREKATNGTVLIESLVEGDDYIGVYVVRNRKIAFQCMLAEESRLNPDGSITAVGLVGPVDLPLSVVTQLDDIMIGLIDRYEIVNAPVSFSMRIYGEQIVPIELHLDFGGELAFDWLISSVLPGGVDDILSGLLDKNCLTPNDTTDANAIIYGSSANILKLAKTYKMSVKHSDKITKASGPQELTLNFVRAIKNMGQGL